MHSEVDLNPYLDFVDQMTLQMKYFQNKLENKKHMIIDLDSDFNLIIMCF